MFTLNVTNNFGEAVGGRLFAPPPPPSGGGYRVWSIPPNGGKESIPNLGSFVLTVPGMGDILILDLGDRKLPQYTNPNIPWTEATWGGIVRFSAIDAYFRYEGGGVVNIVVDNLGSIVVNFPQGGMQVNIEDMTVS